MFLLFKTGPRNLLQGGESLNSVLNQVIWEQGIFEAFPLSWTRNAEILTGGGFEPSDLNSALCGFCAGQWRSVS